MYCEDNQGSDIDHYRPKSQYPSHAFSWTNYLLACSLCNSNYKRSAFPITAHGRPVLLDPTRDGLDRHLRLSLVTGLLVGLTRRGRETIRICALNRPLLVQGRLDAWHALRVLIPQYARDRADGRDAEADGLQTTVRRFPFSSVLWHALAVSAQANPTPAVSPEVLGALAARPEIRTWI